MNYPRKLWLDDVRPPPDDTWIVTRTARGAIALLRAGGIDELSLDHDLGSDDPGANGKAVLNWIEQEMHVRGRRPPKDIRVHSMNPVGRHSMSYIIARIEGAWATIEHERSEG